MTDRKKRDEYAGLADAARQNAVDFMKRANEMIVAIQGGDMENTTDNRDAIRTYCAVASANITVADRLRDQVQFMDASLALPQQVPTGGEEVGQQ